MAEPITTLTDYAIAIECLIFAGLLLGYRWIGRLWATAFLSVSGAAILGGTYHGFAESLSWEHRYGLWQGMLGALAIASFLMVVATAAPLGRGGRVGLLTLAIAKLALGVALATAPWVFALRVVDYLSALGIVLLVQIGQGVQRRSGLPRPPTGAAWMVAGMAISGLAAGVLLMPWPGAIGLSPLAGYHLVQMVALYCIYRSIEASLRGRSGAG